MDPDGFTVERRHRLICVYHHGQQVAVACSGPGGAYIDIVHPDHLTGGLTHVAFQPESVLRHTRVALGFPAESA